MKFNYIIADVNVSTYTICMTVANRKNKRIKKGALKIKDKGLKVIFRKGGRKGARKDFFELLKRAALYSSGLS